MKHFLFGVALVWLAAVPLACNSFGPDQSVILGVSQLDAPASVAANAPIPVVLTVVTGGCLRFDRIEARREASSATLTAWGTDGSIGRKDIMCPADIRPEPHSYQFDPPFTNPFRITVDRGRVSPLVATVQVR
jgi:hypothetical protein